MSVIRGLEWSLRKMDKDFIPNLRKFTVWRAPLHGHVGATFLGEGFVIFELY